jgi:phosphoserine aminotransferase
MFTSPRTTTIHGTEWSSEPLVGDVPLVCDASSDFISRPLEISKYGLIYAGRRKTQGRQGVTMVIVRDDILASVPSGLPSMFDYKLLAERESLYNTPPAFAIYIAGLVFKWLLNEIGGLDGSSEARIARRRRSSTTPLMRAAFTAGTRSQRVVPR